MEYQRIMMMMMMRMIMYASLGGALVFFTNSFVLYKGIRRYFHFSQGRAVHKNNTIAQANQTNNMDGGDHRYRYDDELFLQDTEQELASIKTHMYKMYLLRLMQNNNINIHEKLHIWNEYFEPNYTYNVSAGGLLSTFSTF